MTLGFLFAAVAFMAASVLLVQRVARHFGLAVDPRALALCAVMALVVNFAAILLSAYLTFNHLMMLVVMVLVSAALVTGVNEFLLRRAYSRIAFVGADSTKEPEPDEKDGTPPEEEQPAVPEEVEPPPEPEKDAVWEVALPPEPVAEPSMAEPKPEPEPVVEEPTPEPEPEPVGEEPTPEPEPEPVAEEPEEEPENEFDGLPEELSTLDDYLDYAYAEKDAGRTAKAAAAYQQAIENFPDDPYLPFLFIELGNLYKEVGAYDVAVGTYRDALALPIIQGQNGIMDEFQKNIAYLEAVSHIIARHDAPDTPFSQIPPDWIAEIEADFAKRTGN